MAVSRSRGASSRKSLMLEMSAYTVGGGGGGGGGREEVGKVR
jgi:hypothetical protein